jgi:hypothetical protein
MDGLGLVHDAVGLRGTRRHDQGGTRVRRVDDHGRGVWAALDAVAMREPIGAREVVIEHKHVGT